MTTPLLTGKLYIPPCPARAKRGAASPHDREKDGLIMSKHRTVLAATSGIVVILTLMLSLPASARAVGSAPNSRASLQPGSIDAADLEAFLDDFFERNIEELEIPGAAVVVVQDGEILFIKGYGFADLERQIPVDPSQTVMRVGSVSKLFTATAAMQLVEQGLLDLDADVNQYLTALKVPEAYSQPVTLHQLLTHTAGFEDRWVGTHTLDPDEFAPLGEHLKGSIPKRVLEPGSVHSYSNFSFALAGLLIEEITGMPFAQYVEENLFQPLGMSRSTFAQPVPTELAPDLAVGYFVTDGTYEPGDYLYEQESPAGAMSTTAEDMARFMIAHLQEGRYEDVRILESDTARQMHEQQFTHHPELPGLGYAFKERFVNGERLIGGGGDIGTYSAQMILHPTDDLGFFVMYNVFNDALRERLIAEFMDRYYAEGSPATVPPTMELSQEDLARFTGGYRWVKHPRSTIGKLRALIPGPLTLNIDANDDATLSVSFFGAEAEWRYAPVKPLVYKQVAGGVQEFSGYEFDLGDTLVFREDGSGKVDFAFVPLQSVAMEKLAWYEVGEVQTGALVPFLLIFLTPLVIWPLGAAIGRIRKQSIESTVTTDSKRARWVAGIASVLNFLFLLILLLAPLADMNFGVPPVVRVALIIPIITAVLTLVLLWMTIRAWKDSNWSILGRIYYSFLTLTAVLFVLWVNYWNLLGWRF
jgi:CubicO group peptidase (beta-lactamase class C family)